jgi:hypothetical protein
VIEPAQVLEKHMMRVVACLVICAAIGGPSWWPGAGVALALQQPSPATPQTRTPPKKVSPPPKKALPPAKKAAPSAKKAAAVPRTAATMTRDEMRTFLLTAKIIGEQKTTRGITAPKRLTLSDGVVTRDAGFQSVDAIIPASERNQPGDRFEVNFNDSYRYNLAAFALAELLGIGGMMPVHVEREYDGRTGSLSWWADVQFDEEGRRKKNVQPPNPTEWNQQMYRMRVFTALIRDIDRNLGNILHTPDWRVLMIDFTRAFRLSPQLINQKDLLIIDRALFGKIESLTPAAVQAAVGAYLKKPEVQAVMERRDALVAHYRKVIAERGEAAVFY